MNWDKTIQALIFIGSIAYCVWAVLDDWKRQDRERQSNLMWEKEMTELKPCPFCGASAKLDTAAKADSKMGDKDRILYRVICTERCSTIGWFRSEKYARKAWNRRSYE